MENTWTSPLVDSREEKAAHRQRKAAQRRKKAEEARLKDKINRILDFMKKEDVRLGQFMTFIFNPDNKKGLLCYNQFFNIEGELSQILQWWACSRTGKDEVQAWTLDYVAGLLSKEAKRVTSSKILQTRERTVDHAMVSSFNFTSLYGYLKDLAPTTIQMLKALSTSPRADNEHTDRRKKRTKGIVTSVALTCFGEYSHANNLSKKMTGLYLISTGAQRQTITVMSTLGLSESYTNLITKNLRRKSKKERQLMLESDKNDSGQDVQCESVPQEQVQKRSLYTGTLRQLSESMLSMARDIAKTGLCFTVYDNINMMFRRPEQVVGRHDTQENGTCATMVPLFKAEVEDLNVADYQAHFLNAPKLKLSDVLHTRNEALEFKQHLISTILRIIITHGGAEFERFRTDLDKYQPCTPEKIDLHKTPLYPLETWPINEATILGNIEVDEAIRKTLGQNDEDIPNCSQRLRFHAGDQLSLARFRAIEFIRAGQETGFNAFFGSTWIPGLFHAKMADMLGLLQTHWGKPNAGNRNPGSLSAHNTRLGRLPITISSPPTYRVTRDLVFTSLYARVLHCLLLVSETTSLEQYTTKFTTWDALVKHAEIIFQKYTQPTTVSKLREQRANEKKNPADKPTEGDMVFENAVLFLRDALISRLFTDAVKAGDSGVIVLVLKAWALGFRGNGRTKYAHEMLHIIHHLTNILTPEIRSIILNNWLLNPTGNPNSWVEVDLVQEHLNYWIKTFYRAHGSNASWDWLKVISPCVDAL
ncbi:hypothetical protein CPC08DRAFT_778467, partial [Agrocybe pediades]